MINALSTSATALSKTANANDTKLRKACRDFEAMLVSQMLGEMRQTVQKADLFGSSKKEEIFRGMLDNEIAKDVSQTGSMGIADILYRQISEQQAKKP